MNNNSNIQELITVLNQLGINTSNMTEDDIRRLAELIHKTIQKNSQNSQEDMRKQIERVIKEDPQILDRVKSPSRIINPNGPVIQSPGKNLDKKQPSPMNNNSGLNYTDEHNKRGSSSAPAHNPSAPSISSGVQSANAGSSSFGSRNDSSFASESIDSTNQSKQSSSRATTTSSRGGFGPITPASTAVVGGNHFANKKTNPNWSAQPKNSGAPTSGQGVNGGLYKGVNPQGATSQTAETGEGEPQEPVDLESQNPVEPPSETPTTGATSPKAPAEGAKVGAKSTTSQKKVTKKDEKKSVKNSSESREKTKDAVADSKIDRAKRRLKQNGVDQNDPRQSRRQQFVQPPPIINDGGEAESPDGAPLTPKRSTEPSLLQRIRRGLEGNVKRNREVEDTYDDPRDLLGGLKDKVKQKIKNKIKLWVVAHLPQILMFGGVFLLILLTIIIVVVIITAIIPDLGFIDSNASSNITEASSPTANRCSYTTNGTGGQTTVSDAKVELINCDGVKSKYRVLETVEFEKYVLGVALAEIGPDAPDEALKAQIVAARTYALSRNKGMCPSDPDRCFNGYNKSTNTIRMRACEADQVYWDYEKDIYQQYRGSISLYSPEVNSGKVWKHALSDSQKQRVESLANEVKGEVLQDSNGNPPKISYNNTAQNSMKKQANAGKSYKEILQNQFGISPTSNGVCQTGTIDYGNYQLNTDNAGIIREPLSSFLQSKGSSLDSYNQLIASNVQKAGFGTRAGVVAAAVTLIAELANKYNAKIPYYWGGGHGSTDNLANGNWGSSSCRTTHGGNVYDHCGLDCSGFVGWAIYNGGFGKATTSSDRYANLPGTQSVDLNSSPVLQPGDLLYSSGHVILIVGVDNAKGEYKCAEAAGKNAGVLFTTHKFNDPNYKGLDMTGYYDNNKRG